ncbi:MAG: DinB family protein [Planctomycetaceae bacterium]|nr:DinB family protein [Planctomycetaceae bacterium]
MSRSLGNIIADSLNLSLNYGERLLKDIPSSQFARLACPGGRSIASNHPAFVYGHLSLYGPRILTHLGLPAPAIPAGFEAAFTKDAQCQDDPDATIYPPMEQIVEFFFTGYRAALEALRNATDEQLQQDNPIAGRMTELFPTVGSMHNFYVGGHMMIHLGQVSAWRRMNDLPPA